MISPIDATFCARFIHLLHSMGTPRFSTVALLDKLFHRELIQVVIVSSTENEAKNYGYFLAANLEILNAWHGSKVEYEAKARGVNLPGFLRKWDPETLAKTAFEPSDILEHEEFRQAMNKWQQKLVFQSRGEWV